MRPRASRQPNGTPRQVSGLQAPYRRMHRPNRRAHSNAARSLPQVRVLVVGLLGMRAAPNRDGATQVRARIASASVKSEGS